MTSPDVPTTRDALLERIRAAYAEFDASVRAVPDELLLVAGASGDWSVRDVLGHTSSAWLVAQLEAHRDGRMPAALECYGMEMPPPPPDGADVSTQDGRNAWEHLRERELSLEAIRARSRDVRSRLIALIEATTDEHLAVAYAIVDHPLTGRLRPAEEGDDLAAPLWRWIQGNSWHHHEDHARGIRAFVERARAEAR